MSNLTIDERADVLNSYIVLSTLEQELQDAKDSGTYDAGSGMEEVIQVLERAVEMANDY